MRRQENELNKGVEHNQPTFCIMNTRTAVAVTTRHSVLPLVSISLYENSLYYCQDCILLSVVSSLCLLSERDGMPSASQGSSVRRLT